MTKTSQDIRKASHRVYLSVQEREIVEAKAKQRGVPTRHYIRQQILGTGDLAEIYEELTQIKSMIANNGGDSGQVIEHLQTIARSLTSTQSTWLEKLAKVVSSLAVRIICSVGSRRS